jgi:CubicO group peptidase (beta-lactamase class C family)
VSLQPQTVHRLDELVATAQAQGRVPSLAVGIVSDGALAHLSTAGELPVPEPDTQYRIGSITKTMTAAVVLSLRDEGLLDLDAPLEAHLPGTPLGGVSLRHLLTHVGGAQREPEGEWWERAAGGGLSDLLAGLSADTVAFAPRRTYHYSNLAYGLLGAVIAKVGGDDWWPLVRDRLLGPLGMRRTTYQAEAPFARGYVVHPWHGTLREEPRHDAGAMAPAGQLWSTPADLARWAACLADPDPAVLARATLDELCVPAVITDPDAWTGGHGLGVQLWRRGERIFVGHTGSMPGYLAALAVHRPSRTGVVAFANAYTLRRTGGLGGLALSVLDAVLDAEPRGRAAPWRPGAAPPEHVEPLCGRWWWMGREFEAHWEDDAHELVIRSVTTPGAAPWRFTPAGTDRWRCRSGENNGEFLRVRRGRAGAVSALDIATFVFTRQP